MIRVTPNARPVPHMPTHSSTKMSLLLGAALLALVLLGVSATTSSGDVAQRVVDVPTRPGVTQRFLLLSPREPKATVVLFAGDHGGLQVLPLPRHAGVDAQARRGPDEGADRGHGRREPR